MKYLLVIFICGMAACLSPDEIPADIQGINEMKPIIWDMMRAGSLTQNKYGTDTAMLLKETKNMYAQVFKVHNISKEAFYSSYKYYLEHPDKHKILIDSVMAFANRKRNDMFSGKVMPVQ